MTNYIKIERDFIERTLKIIDQYEDLVRPQLGKDSQFEVTLLLNCLLGLLVYPQQIANHSDNQKYFDRWLTDELLVDVGEEWGIRPNDILNPGHKKVGKKDKKITLNELTLRNLVRQMRNCIAHARFSVNDTSPDKQIEYVIFHDTSRKDKDGFHLKMNVKNLNTFVQKLCDTALDRIPKED